MMVRKLRKRLRLTPLTPRVHDLVADGEIDGTTGNVPLFSVFTRGNLRRLVSVGLKNGRSHDLCAIPPAQTHICVFNVQNQRSRSRRYAYMGL